MNNFETCKIDITFDFDLLTIYFRGVYLICIYYMQFIFVNMQITPIKIDIHVMN